MATITLTINNQTKTISVDPNTPLLWVLRDTLRLTGTKYSCGIGICGSCTIHVNGNAVRACVTPVSDVEGAHITTIEGLSTDGDHPVQKAWLAENVSQCGFCQPGQIMNAAALLAKNPTPGNQEIDEAMSGNLCRCGTYQRIKKAIHTAAGES